MNNCYNNGVEGGHNHMPEAWPVPMITAVALLRRGSLFPADFNGGWYSGLDAGG